MSERSVRRIRSLPIDLFSDTDGGGAHLLDRLVRQVTLDAASLTRTEGRLRRLFAKHGWLVKRVAALPLHLLVFSILTFVLIRLIPGDPVLTVTGGQVTPASYQAAKRSLGLDGSLVHQLWTFLGHLAHFNLGTSITTKHSVLQEIGQRLPDTVELALLGMLLTVILSLLGSYVAVLYPASIIGRVVRGYARTAGAVPEFCLGVAGILVLYGVLHWAPAPIGIVTPGVSLASSITGMPLVDALLQGDISVAGNIAEHLAMPVAVMGLTYAPLLLKLLISGLEEAVDAAPTRFRIASGASRRAVLLSMYRRAAPVAVTMLAILFGYLLGGAVVLESLFSLGGMGQYAVAAVQSGDIVDLQGFLLVVAAMTLAVYLIVDVLNMLLDPRRRTRAVEGGQ
jgi:ABC-type dipeptide/oligopeptide/nickel transport system permease component